jgi:hypothetical protein
MKRISWYTSKLPCFVIQQLLVTEALPPEQAADLAHDLAGGLFLVRSSIFAAVLTWLAQLRARSFVKAQLLPAACAALSEYLQRDVRLGEVRSVSPIGVTLQTFSIGPHREEFSCTEVPVMKIRARPFTSLRRGKVVIDAVLSEPSVLVSGERASARDQQETVAAYSLETASTPSRMTQRVRIFYKYPPPPGESTLGAGLYLP